MGKVKRIQPGDLVARPITTSLIAFSFKGRTKIWPPGSLEEKVQNLVKTWEMEIFHKTCPQHFKSFDPTNFTFSTNGRKGITLEEVQRLGGGYNAFLQTTMPENLRAYNPSEETPESSHLAFTTAFPRGFALEILQVYSGPPVIVYKFRHWAYMEGPFKGHPPTGDLLELFGIATLEVDQNMKILKVEFFFDPGELIGGLIKATNDESDSTQSGDTTPCPILRRSRES